MTLVDLKCPNCGAGLDAPVANGEYRCAFCNHVSNASPRPAAVAAWRPLGLSTRGSAEIRQRLRAEARAGQRNGAIFVLCLGAPVALGAVVLAVVGAMSNVGLFIPAAICAVFGGLMLFLGVFNIRDVARTDRLRREGLRGLATIQSYKERGSNSFQLVLRVELPSREPYEVRTRQYVGSNWTSITTDATLPVLVSPGDPQDLMFLFDD